MRFEPPLDSVIVERELVKKIGDIELPEKEWKSKWYGKIIAVGPGMLRTIPGPNGEGDRYPMQYAVGDLVICPPGMTAFPDDIPIAHNENMGLYICSERQLLAKIIPEKGDDMPCNGKAK